jgi:hypothetical protein
MLPSFDRSTKFLILVAFLVLSMTSLRSLPFRQPIGFDLSNLVAYQKCATGVSPYLIDGHTCGDVADRFMSYPPLLFHSFRWLRPLSLQTAMHLWVPFLLLGMGVTLYLWARLAARPAADDRRWELPIFCGLLLVQYPFVFELERGQSDVVPLLLVTFGAWLFKYKKHSLAGVTMGLATAYKLYPLLVCAVVTIGLLMAWRHRGRRVNADWLRFGASALAAFVAVNLAFFPDAKLYFLRVLPRVSDSYIPASVWVHSHAFPSLAGAQYSRFSWAFCIGLVALWGWAAEQAILHGDALSAVAGGLAISTYFYAYSYDYNLVTTYPLLMLLFLRARQTGRWGVFALGVFAIAADRRIFADPQSLWLNPTMRITLQLAFLAISAVEVAQPTTERSA